MYDRAKSSTVPLAFASALALMVGSVGSVVEGCHGARALHRAARRDGWCRLVGHRTLQSVVCTSAAVLLIASMARMDACARSGWQWCTSWQRLPKPAAFRAKRSGKQQAPVQH